MPDGAASSGTSDPLVASVERQVTELAHGNPFAKEGFLFVGTRENRVVSLTMRVDVAPTRNSQILRGQAEPAGSTRCHDAEASDSFLDVAFRKSASSPDTLGSVMSRLRADPVRAFSETQDGFAVGAAAGRSHVHQPCRECSRTGVVQCGGCGGQGTTRCLMCHDGKRQCTRCSHGTIYYKERVWNYAIQAYEDANRSRSCGHCWGTGRSDRCATCNGQMKVRCAGCGGCGTVSCGTCGRTGWLTVATTVSLVGKPVRKIAFDAGAPPEFRESVATLEIKELPVLHGETVRKMVDAVEGRAVVTLDCCVPHVRLDARFGPGFEQSFDAVGLLARVAIMPVFLDRMLAPLSDQIRVAASEKRATDVLRLAKETRVTCTVLVAVSGRYGHGLEALRHIWKGAASDEVLNAFLGHTRTAYDAIGAAAARRPWQMLALPVVAAAAAAIPLHVAAPVLAVLAINRSKVPLAEPVLSALLGLLPLGLAFTFAGRQTRRAVRALVGEGAVRIPRQGWWPRAVAAAAVLAMFAATAETDRPKTAPALPNERVSPRAVAVRPSASGTVHLSLLSPTSLPRLQPSFRVDRTRGAPDIFWLQYHLRQLGFLHADPDGLVHPSTYDSLTMFNDALPRSRKRFRPGWDAAATAAAALKNEFGLERLPIDRFPVPGLSNIARANLTGMDVVSMQRAANQARAEPGQQVSWRSTDRARGGRLIATWLPTGCPMLQVEIEIRGAVETAGPFPDCRDQRR